MLETKSKRKKTLKRKEGRTDLDQRRDSRANLEK